MKFMKYLLMAFVCIIASKADSSVFQNVASQAGVANTGSGNAAEWLDYDADGFLDLYFVNMSSGGGVYRNLGNGTFQSVSLGLPASGDALSVRDIDMDGYVDVVRGIGIGNNLNIYKNQPSGNSRVFQDMTSISGISVSGAVNWPNYTWGNFNGDLLPDLYEGASHKLYVNNGNFSFTEMANAFPVAPIAAGNSSWLDYNNDGRDDLLLVPTSGTCKLYLNNSDNTFTDISSSSGVDQVDISTSARLAVGDYDQDGYDDIYLYLGGSRNVLFHNNTDGTLTNVSVMAGVQTTAGNGVNGGAEFFDYDNDGDLDLFANGGRYGSNSFFRNNENGTFTDITSLTGLSNTDDTHDIAIGDYNNDGYLDIYEVNFTGSGSSANKLYLNTLPEPTALTLLGVGAAALIRRKRG